MAIHRFPLESVLEVRRFREEECESALASAMRDLDREQRILRDLKAELYALRERMAEGRAAGPIALARILEQDAYLGVLCQRLDAQANKVQLQTQKVSEAREALLLASRDRRVVERLKERFEEELKRDRESREQHRVDELASVRYLFRKRGDAAGSATRTSR